MGVRPHRTQLPVAWLRILWARQTAYSASAALIARLQRATFGFEFRAMFARGATFATGKHRAMKPGFFSGSFTNVRAAGLLPNTAKVLPLMDLNAIKVGPPC
jgi:hypothetical protein